MRVLWRTLLVLVTFAVAGGITLHVLTARAVARGIPEASVRLGVWMGALFVGGVCATLVAVAVLVGRKAGLAEGDES